MKVKKILAMTIYIFGYLCVIYFLMKALMGGNHVANPNAMIPYTDFDAATIMLAIGCIPMVASCIAVIKCFDIKKKVQRIVVMIPGIITGISFVVHAVFVVFLVLLGLLEAAGLR